MKAHLRVAMIIQAYHPLIGGAERLLAELIPFLKSHDIEIHILTRRYPGLASFEMIAGVPVHRLPIPGPKPMAALSFVLTAMPLLRRLRPDIVHAHELLSPTTTAIVAKRLYGTPVVAMPHRGGYLGDIYKLHHKMMGKIRIEVMKRWVDSFIAISSEIDSELADVGVPIERRIFIPNAVDTERFKPISQGKKPSLRKKLQLPEGPIALFVGRLVPEKCLDQLISIWPEVRNEHPKANLLLLGQGPEKDKLKQAATDGVHFSGQVDDVVPYLQASDVFVLPSATEGMSIALLEAMSVGIPVIATAVGGTPDVINHGKNGWLIPPNRSDVLKESLITILKDEPLQFRLGIEARNNTVDDYSIVNVALRLQSLYMQVAAKKQNDP